ncbi:hypothetical protein FACS1894110_26310 [Spirochaetia bacterium]|nr:hypothetical protein FACS1894110_26310 [Spirochaetia bacterium]
MKKVVVFAMFLGIVASAISAQDSLTYIEISNHTAKTVITVQTIGEYRKLIEQYKIQIILYDANSFFFENNTVLYSIASNGYKTIYEYETGFTQGFKNGESYYFAQENGLATQDEVDNYESENYLAVGEVYLPQSKISVLPKFDEIKIRQNMVYPRVAWDSGIEGTVYLELFIDRSGVVRQVKILKEDPQGRGFGEAAVKAFDGIAAQSPAQANGENVSVRYRYPVSFRNR